MSSLLISFKPIINQLKKKYIKFKQSKFSHHKK